MDLRAHPGINNLVYSGFDITKPGFQSMLVMVAGVVGDRASDPREIGR